MDPELDDAPELTEYYDISDAGDEWHLSCRKCRKFFALLKSSRSVAWRLALLAHARSHDTTAGEGVDRG